MDGRGDLQWANRTGGIAGIDAASGRLVMKVAQGRGVYTTKGRVTHELTHLLQEVRSPGLMAREAGIFGKPLSFTETFAIERQAYMVQHGQSILGRAVTYPEALLNAGMAKHPVATGITVIGGSIGVGSAASLIIDD